MNTKQNEYHSYTLSKCWLRVIVVYYVVIMLLGIIVSIFVITNIERKEPYNILLYTTIGSMCVSAMLCSVQYLRRIYKACLDSKIELLQINENFQQFGNIIYFILCPFFAIVFVIIMILTLLSSVNIVASENFQINERFLFFCIIMSSFIGFSIGRILDRFEELSSKKVNKIFDIHKENLNEL